MNSNLIRLGAVLGVAWLVYTRVPNAIVKGMAMTIGSIALAKQIPVVKDYV